MSVGINSGSHFQTNLTPGAPITTNANGVFISGVDSGGIVTLNGSSGSATGTTVTLSPGTTGLTYTGSGATMTTAGTLAIANGGTNASSMATTNGTIYYNGTSLVTTVGNRVLLDSQNASNSATLTFTTGFSTSFTSYVFEFITLRPATDNQMFQLQRSADGGGTWITTNTYLWVHSGLNSAAAATTSTSGSGQPCNLLSVGCSNGSGIMGTLQIWNISQGSPKRGTIHVAFQDTATNLVNSQGSVFFTSAIIENGIRFLFASGNITSGTIRMFGVT